MKLNVSSNVLVIMLIILVALDVSNKQYSKMAVHCSRATKSHTLYIACETNTLTHFSQGLPIAALAFVAVTPTLLAAQHIFCGRVPEALVVT